MTLKNHLYLIPMVLFSIFCWSRLSYPVIGDEIIYLFPELDKLSFIELIPGFHQKDIYYGHPPLYSLTLGLFRALFGENFFPLRVFSLLTFFSCLYLIFNLLKESEGLLVAYWGFFTILFNQVLITHSTMILPDLLFTTLGLASWFFFQKR